MWRSLRDVRPGGIPQQDLRKAFVCLDWGCSAPSVAYLCLPDSVGAPKGSIHLLDEFYVAASTAGGQRDWNRGTYLSNAEQATGSIEWMSRWNLRPGSTKVVAECSLAVVACDAFFARGAWIDPGVNQPFRCRIIALIGSVVAGAGVIPADQSWPWWPLLPLRSV
ncbi:MULTISPECIES: hypothetical protein [unclassified Synechococcus]|uniref:hypothetical protein n=1 Tax=unclassified Synechococcus TaxID=2626047 RepID=UPI0039AF7A80